MGYPHPWLCEKWTWEQQSSPQIEMSHPWEQSSSFLQNKHYVPEHIEEVTHSQTPSWRPECLWWEWLTGSLTQEMFCLGQTFLTGQTSQQSGSIQWVLDGVSVWPAACCSILLTATFLISLETGSMDVLAHSPLRTRPDSHFSVFSTSLVHRPYYAASD